MPEWLEPTELVNSGDPRVALKAAELASPWATPRGKAEAIASFVREWIRLELRSSVQVARASEVLCFMEGSATEKAVLFAALCRSAGLPCRIILQELNGAPDRWTALGVLARVEWSIAHPINEVLLEGEWVAMDVSLDSETASRLGLKMPALSGPGTATLREAVAWVPESVLSVKGNPASSEGIPLEILRLTETG